MGGMSSTTSLGEGVQSASAKKLFELLSKVVWIEVLGGRLGVLVGHTGEDGGRA